PSHPERVLVPDEQYPQRKRRPSEHARHALPPVPTNPSVGHPIRWHIHKTRILARAVQRSSSCHSARNCRKWGTDNFFPLRQIRISAVHSLHARCKFLTQLSHIWFTQYLDMTEVNLMDLYPTMSPGSPSHMRVVNIVERLFWSLEQSDRSAEAERREIFRPVGPPPFDPSRTPSS